MMDDLPGMCYTGPMSEQLEKNTKQEGFKGERTIILPTEAFKDFTQHPLVRRLYLTDVGFYPRAQDHYRERKDGIEEYILIYCTEGRGVIQVEGREYDLGANQAFCIPRWRGHRYWACGGGALEHSLGAL